MKGRDLKVQLGAVVAGTVAVLAAQTAPEVAPVSLLFGAVVYVVVFAGMHLYYARENDVAVVTDTARRRFSYLVVLSMAALVLGVGVNSGAVAGLPYGTALTGAVVLAFAVYWVYEVQRGYRA